MTLLLSKPNTNSSNPKATPPPGTLSKMSTLSQNPNQSSSYTSPEEGPDLGELKKLWREGACSEERLNLMTELRNRKIGFNEIEMFSLGLEYNLKSTKMKDSKKPTQKIVTTVMEMKIRDEAQHLREIRKKKQKMRKWLEKTMEPKIHQYKRMIKELRREAEMARQSSREKNWKKLEHLEKKYGETEEEKNEPPTGMEHLSHLSIFRNRKFEEIEVTETEVKKIGEVTITEEEERILRRTPKFAIPERLLEDSLREDMEKAYAKMRMELMDEETEEEELNPELTKPIIETEEEKEKLAKNKEYEAKSRQVYDPIEDTYDDRNRKVTDLVECSRITLPKPLSITREAQIELRRELHNKVYQEYRKEFCDKNGEQEMEISLEERKGLRSLQKRIEKEELLIIKTDKSGKLSVTNRENYLKMGEPHVKKDQIVDRTKVREIDKIMGEHSAAWCSIWGSGSNHGQADRVINSKVTRSENTAKLYLAHKDHKLEENKTRPIGTANPSNTRGFANSVSDLLEAIANSKKQKYEVIS